MQGEQIILGIDPGTTIMGFGLIKTTKTCKKRFWPKKMENLVKNTFVI